MCGKKPGPETTPAQSSLTPAATPLRIDVIVNAAARAAGAPDLVQTLTDAFAPFGHDVRITALHADTDVAAVVADLCRVKPDVIVAGGGDGTINTVAQGAAEAGIPLGVLPLGTLNHFAKDLGIPLALEDAVRTICTGRVSTVDIGEVGERIFLNNSSLGVYPRIVRHRDGQMRRNKRSKWFALAVATMTVMRVVPIFRFHVSIDGEEEDFRTSLLLIGNNDYIMDGLHFGERRRLDAGHLSLYTPRRRGHAGLLALALRALRGKLGEDSGFQIRAGKEIIVTSSQSHLQVAIDGEVSTMPTPLVYRIRPGGLRVVVP